MASPVFLMSPPRADWTLKGKANFLSQTEGAQADPVQARADWLAIADGIEAAGGVVVVLPPDPDLNLTGMPYVAEAGMLGHDEDGPVFVLPNVKPPHRRSEASHIEAFVKSALGMRTRAPNALWEGQGDALRVDDQRVVHTAGDGPSARTVPAAYDEVHQFFSERSVLLRFHAQPWFHGNTFLGFYRGRGRLVALCCTAALQDGEEAKLRAFVKDAELVVVDPVASKAYATNALQVNDTVLAPAGLPSTVHDLWEGLGLRVVQLTLPALFSTGGGAAVCLTNRLDGLARDDVPREHLFATTRDRWAAL